MKVVELRAALKARGLDTSGLKAVLVERLAAAEAADDAEPVADADADAPAAADATAAALAVAPATPAATPTPTPTTEAGAGAGAEAEAAALPSPSTDAVASATASHVSTTSASTSMPTPTPTPTPMLADDNTPPPETAVARLVRLKAERVAAKAAKRAAAAQARAALVAKLGGDSTAAATSASASITPSVSGGSKQDKKKAAKKARQRAARQLKQAQEHAARAAAAALQQPLSSPHSSTSTSTSTSTSSSSAASTTTTTTPAVVYAIDEVGLQPGQPGYEEFARVFQRHEELAVAAATARAAQATERATDAAAATAASHLTDSTSAGAATSFASTASFSAAAAGGGVDTQALSNKQRKKLHKLTVSQLKQLARNPSVVSEHDCNSPDPRLLVYLKSYRNTVAVPAHWSQKRKYLQNKRGVELSSWELPQFIEDTGIGKMREAEGERTGNTIARQRNVKLGRMDVDYQVLHDAFFRYQTPPPLTKLGDLYYEGKEFNVNLKLRQPGVLSKPLQEALGMLNGPLSPPPWLFNMQRYGPPPAYPNLKIGGVTAPIPEGTRYGYGEGEWGKPPVDQFGRPLYGDVFGQEQRSSAGGDAATNVDRTLWGQIEEEEEEEEESSSEEEDSDEDSDVDEEDADENAADSGTQEIVHLRKSASSAAMAAPAGASAAAAVSATNADGAPAPSLYTVLEAKQVNVDSGTLFGSSHTYELPPTELGVAAPVKRKPTGGAVDVNLTAEELEGGIDAAALKRKYEQQVSVQRAAAADSRVDVSDVFAEQQKKRAKHSGSGKAAGKDFKF